MIRRRVMIAVAAACLVLPLPAFAGGAGATIPVRMKNVGRQSVGVNAVSGAPSPSKLLTGGRNISPNAVSQFMVKRGAFTAAAAKPSAPLVVNKVRKFDTRTFKTIYLYASQDGTTATLVGAPGGVKF
ncbi:MAG: hypothetical protein K8S94_13835 [Planctomycetia bacterium]|nr:hypothetical protein [Planctomycetia bacterium]